MILIHGVRLAVCPFLTLNLLRALPLIPKKQLTTLLEGYSTQVSNSEGTIFYDFIFHKDQLKTFEPD